MNEIREAFDQYRSVLQNTKKQDKLLQYPEIKDVDLSVEYDDSMDSNYKHNSWESSRRDATSEKSSVPFNYNLQSSKHVPPSSNDHFLRHKRIFTTTSTTTQRTTTTLKSIDSYEYDDDNDTSNRRLNDDAQVSSLRLNRDVSFLGQS